jgi:integrase
LPQEVLLFIIFTGGVRTTEVRQMPWNEFKEEDSLWVVPPDRHKGGKKTKQIHLKQPHYVPLNKQALAILKKMRALQAKDGVDTKYVFAHLSTKERRRRHPKDLTGLPLGGNSSVLHFLQMSIEKGDHRSGLGRKDLTVHGFRDTFSTWAHEKGYDYEDIERILGHTIKQTGRGVEVTGVARLYDKSLRLAQCRQILDDWGAYCTRVGPPPSGITDIREWQRRVASA